MQRFTVKRPILSIHCEAHTVVRGTWTAGHNRMVHNELREALCNGRLSPQAEPLGAGTGPYSPSV